jgi:hypothetical protein
MVKAIPTARDSVGANLDRDTFIPYHPGAVRYYRESGIRIPAVLASDRSSEQRFPIKSASV